MTVVRATQVRAAWTDSMETLIKPHEQYAREVKGRGGAGGLLPRAALWPLRLRGSGRAVLRVCRVSSSIPTVIASGSSRSARPWTARYRRIAQRRNGSRAFTGELDVVKHSTDREDRPLETCNDGDRAPVRRPAHAPREGTGTRRVPGVARRTGTTPGTTRRPDRRRHRHRRHRTRHHALHRSCQPRWHHPDGHGTGRCSRRRPWGRRSAATGHRTRAASHCFAFFPRRPTHRTPYSGGGSFSLDAGRQKNAVLDGYLEALAGSCQQIAHREDLDFAYEQLLSVSPVPLDNDARSARRSVCR